MIHGLKFIPDLCKLWDNFLWSCIFNKSKIFVSVTFFFICVLSNDFNCGQSGIISAKLPDRELFWLLSNVLAAGDFLTPLHFKAMLLGVTSAYKT